MTDNNQDHVTDYNKDPNVTDNNQGPNAQRNPVYNSLGLKNLLFVCG